MASVTTQYVDPGEDLLSALRSLAKENSAAWVQGVGRVRDVVLVADESDGPRKAAGPHQLLGLAGPASGPLVASLLAPGASGPAVLAGEIRSAVSLGVHVAVFSSAAPSPSPLADEKLPISGSEPTSSAPEEESDELPQYLDQVEHPVFGLCDVMVVKGERLKLRAADGSGRLREIHLRVMKVLPPQQVGGKRVFRLVKRDS